tara:strand:+ start:1056 stop:1292 length:237 start_codon:yes stop_codon:yes gene_type:complete
MWTKEFIDYGDGQVTEWTTSINDITVFWNGKSDFEFYTDGESDAELLTDYSITSCFFHQKKAYETAKQFIEDMKMEAA